MTKMIIRAIFIFITVCAINPCFAHPCHNGGYHHPSIKEQDKIDKMFEQRLQLTPEQIDYLKKAKAKNRKEVQTAIKKLEQKRDEIRNIYMLGLPRFQAELRSAPLKAELVILKQNADRLRENHRKDFESILTPDQKLEFEKMRKEFAAKKAQSMR